LKELIIGTTNKAKIAQIRGVLAPLKISVSGVADKNLLPKVAENGQTARENAHLKAVAYAKALNKIVFSMDNALFIDGLPDDQQPGLHVRRINKSDDRVSDDELLEYYLKIFMGLGESITGHWEVGVCVATPQGKCAETTIISQRIFTSHPSLNKVDGYPLESIQIDPESGKIISDMSQQEQDEFWQRIIGKQLQEFVCSLDLD